MVSRGKEGKKKDRVWPGDRDIATRGESIVFGSFLGVPNQPFEL